MPWFKVDDALSMHMKAFAAGNQALGLWVRAGSWSMHQLSDGFIPRGVVAALGGNWDDAAALINAGLWHEAPEGYQFHDWAEYQPTREQVIADRSSNQRRQELSRNPKLRDAIRSRDGDFCRYCGVIVNWSDRKSTTGATYDHVDPHGANDIENLVVACRGCNARKGQRTPTEAGMPLMRPRSVSRSHPVTNQAPSRPDPTHGLTDYISQSNDEIRSETVIRELGIDPQRLIAHIREKTGRQVGFVAASGVALTVLARSENVAKPQAYVLAAITRDPQEIRDLLPTPTPKRDSMCGKHPEWPVPCEKCAREAA